MIRTFILASGAAREKLEELLESSATTIIGWAENLEVADEELVSEAEVLLVDRGKEPLEDLVDELQEARVLRQSKVVLLLEQGPSPNVLNRVLRAGVRGVLPSGIGEEELSAALAAVSSGLVVIDPRELTRAAADPGGESLEFVEPLTAREKQVLQMLSEGLGNKEIAARLKLSEHTVKFHVAAILGKLGASTRTEAVSVAMRRGLILV